MSPFETLLNIMDVTVLKTLSARVSGDPELPQHLTKRRSRGWHARVGTNWEGWKGRDHLKADLLLPRTSIDSSQWFPKKLVQLNVTIGP